MTSPLSKYVTLKEAQACFQGGTIFSKVGEVEGISADTLCVSKHVFYKNILGQIQHLFVNINPDGKGNPWYVCQTDVFLPYIGNLTDGNGDFRKLNEPVVRMLHDRFYD